jgi:Phosphatidylinositol-4-phosphate 5-Kinase
MTMTVFPAIFAVHHSLLFFHSIYSQVGIHNRHLRQTSNPENSEEHEIAGPVGQHSNTPFRRNMSTAPPSVSHRQASPTNSPYTPHNRKISLTSPPIMRPPSTGFRNREKIEGDFEYGCDVDADPFSAVRVRRNSLNAQNGLDDGCSDGASPSSSTMQMKKLRSRAVRSTSICSANEGDESAGDTTKPANEQRGSARVLRPVSMGAMRKRTPPRRVDRDLAEISTSRDESELKSAPFTSGAEECEYDDDDDYSMDDDDIDLDFVKSDLELETEDEDHYDDGDSDIEAESETPHVSLSKVPPISGFDTLKREDRSEETPVSAPHTRRECEDEGEGLKGIEGSQLAPMVRMSLGGLLKPFRGKSRPSTGTDAESPCCAPGPGNRSPAACVVDMDMVHNKDSMVTFGPGASQRHPWTLRKDSGINSRELDATRGDEIYYIGVIDILQQYNLRKRAETLIKVRSSRHCFMSYLN